MSPNQRTPEAVVQRADSKNPSTTCRGLTTNGRPCRRALAQPSQASPIPCGEHGVLAVLQNGQKRSRFAAAAYYCWQHKDQAEKILDINHTEVVPIPEERTSIDTLVERLGIIELAEDVDDTPTKQKVRRKSQPSRVVKRDTLPQGWHDMEGPLMSVPDEVIHPKTRVRKGKHAQGRSNTSLWCCLRTDDDSPSPARMRHTASKSSMQKKAPIPRFYPSVVAAQPNTPQIDPRHNQYQPQRTKHSAPTPSTNQIIAPTRHNEYRKSGSHIQETSQIYPNQTLYPDLLTPVRISSKQQPSETITAISPHTQLLLSLIPRSLSPSTTALLLTELSKRPSPHDKPGYIYVFWLTPSSLGSRPDDDIASTLFDDLEDAYRAERERGMVQRHTSRKGATPRKHPVILFKIGRAENVHRRLSQWQKQCGQDITLVRWYPYQPKHDLDIPRTPTKVPHAHRVERLIHIELADRRIKDQGACEACGKQHQEWFEIEASRKGLKAIDDSIKRWAAYDQGMT